jgi:2'-5' RNA ligase
VGAEELASLVGAGILAPAEARRRYIGGYTTDFTVEEQAPEAVPAPPAPTDPTAADRADAAPQRESTLIALAQDPIPDLLAQVRAIVPDLEVEEWPHLTLLYLGDVPSRDMPAIMRAVVEHAEDWPESLIPDYVGPLGDEGAVVLHLRGAGLIGPQNRLLRALTAKTRAQQFPRFLPHITLGYAPALDDQQIERLAALTVPRSLGAGPLVLRRGDDDRLRVDAEDPSYVPPKGAQEAATRALAVREKKPPSERGMTAVGLARARDLTNGRALSAETVRRMKAYFDRHQGDKDGATWGEQGKGWQAWMGWGGDVGWRWATRIVERLDRDA